MRYPIKNRKRLVLICRRFVGLRERKSQEKCLEANKAVPIKKQLPNEMST